MKAFLNKKNIKRIIFLKGFTHSELAKKVGISEPYISSLMSGKSAIGPKTAQKFISVLDVEADDIFVFIESEDE